MVKVKICGITDADDAKAAVDSGADALGFVFFKGSPRCVSPQQAHAIIKTLPSFIQTVGVFVDEPAENINTIISESGIDIIQLHGDETPERYVFPRRTIKAVRVKSLESLAPLVQFRDRVSAFLLDAFSPEARGGTGITINWDIAVTAKQFGRIILAGGLTPDNVSDAVTYVEPYAIDVSSGIERSKGKKDHHKMRLFIERAKTAIPD